MYSEPGFIEGNDWSPTCVWDLLCLWDCFCGVILRTWNFMLCLLDLWCDWRFLYSLDLFSVYMIYICELYLITWTFILNLILYFVCESLNMTCRTLIWYLRDLSDIGEFLHMYVGFCICKIYLVYVVFAYVKFIWCLCVFKTEILYCVCEFLYWDN